MSSNNAKAVESPVRQSPQQTKTSLGLPGTDNQTDLSESALTKKLDWITNIQVTCFFVCVWFFFIGTVFLAPDIEDISVGGWIFLVGSFGFCISDAGELLKQSIMLNECTKTGNHMVSLPPERLSITRPSNSAQNNISSSFALPISENGRSDSLGFPLLDDTSNKRDPMAFTRILTKISFGGSLLFLVGSVLFIPSSTFVIAIFIFAVGSFLFTSLSIVRIYLAGCHDNGDNDIGSDKSTRNGKFKWKNLLNDFSAVLIDINSGVASAMFFVGSILYLPKFESNIIYFWVAWSLFQIGSAAYGISSCIVVYKLRQYWKSQKQ